MAGGSSGSYESEGGGGITGINVTPLVDVMLVLLIIFIATAPMIANRGIEANLPKTESGSEVDKKLVVTLDVNGQLYVNDKKYDDRDKARDELVRIQRRAPEVQATIVADKTIPYGDIMDVIDMIKKVHIKKFALASDRKAVRDDAE